MNEYKLILKNKNEKMIVRYYSNLDIKEVKAYLKKNSHVSSGNITVNVNSWDSCEVEMVC